MSDSLKAKALRTYIIQGSFLLDLLKSLIPNCSSDTQLALSSYLQQVESMGEIQEILNFDYLVDGERYVLNSHNVYFGNVYQAARMLPIPNDDINIKWCNILIVRRDKALDRNSLIQDNLRITQRQLRELKFPNSFMHRDDGQRNWP